MGGGVQNCPHLRITDTALWRSHATHSDLYLSRSGVDLGLEVPHWGPLWLDVGAAGREVKSSQFCFLKWLPFSLLADRIGSWDIGRLLVGRYPSPLRDQERTERKEVRAELSRSLRLQLLDREHEQGLLRLLGSQSCQEGTRPEEIWRWSSGEGKEVSTSEASGHRSSSPSLLRKQVGSAFVCNCKNFYCKNKHTTLFIKKSSDNLTLLKFNKYLFWPSKCTATNIFYNYISTGAQLGYSNPECRLRTWLLGSNPRSTTYRIRDHGKVTDLFMT